MQGLGFSLGIQYLRSGPERGFRCRKFSRVSILGFVGFGLGASTNPTAVWCTQPPVRQLGTV